MNKKQVAYVNSEGVLSMVYVKVNEQGVLVTLDGVPFGCLIGIHAPVVKGQCKSCNQYV